MGSGAFGKTAGQAIQQAKALIHLVSTQGLKCQLFRFTRCFHQAVFPLGCNALPTHVSCHEKQPFSIPPVRNRVPISLHPRP